MDRRGLKRGKKKIPLGEKGFSGGRDKTTNKNSDSGSTCKERGGKEWGKKGFIRLVKTDQKKKRRGQPLTKAKEDHEKKGR